MAAKKQQCEMQHCDRKVGHPNSGLCKPCYAALWYWQNLRTPTELIKRQKNLRLYSERMAVVSGVRSANPKRK